MPESVINVRKYGNRKLYDEESSQYISMLELSDLVAAGKIVRVVCDLTGSDLTVETLARALYERVKASRGAHGLKPATLARVVAMVALKKDSE